jgi:membrane protease YdiL (CAAX protease family)
MKRYAAAADWRSCALLHRLTDAELEWLSQRVERRQLAAGEFLVLEGAEPTHLFVIEAGDVEVLKAEVGTEQKRLHRIAQLGPGDVVGEIALLDRLPRTASVRALTALAVVALPLPGLSHHEAPSRDVQNQVYFKVSANLALLLAGKLRAGSQTQLETEQERANIGDLVVNVLTLLCCYMVALAALPALGLKPANTSLVSLPLICAFGVVSFRTIRGSGYPLRYFGLSAQNLGAALGHNVFTTGVLIVGITLIKWAVLRWNGVSDNGLIEYPDPTVHLQSTRSLLFAAVYCVSAIVQELIVRSTLQSMLERYLTGEFARTRAIVVCSLLFAVSHLHTSLLFAVVVFLPGLVWGWSFSRYRNLAGVVLSHIAVGLYVFFVLGVRVH